jgi:N-methylhydantoinase B
VKAAINYNIDHTNSRLREEVAQWPDGEYEADVWIDHDTMGTRCPRAGDLHHQRVTSSPWT